MYCRPGDDCAPVGQTGGIGKTDTGKGIHSMHNRKPGSGRSQNRSGNKPRKPYFPPQVIDSVTIQKAADMAAEMNCPLRR